MLWTTRQRRDAHHKTTPAHSTQHRRTQELALWSSLTLTRLHWWVPAGHTRYTSASTQQVYAKTQHHTVAEHAYAPRRARPPRLFGLCDECNVNSDWNASCCYLQGDWGLDFLIAKDAEKKNDVLSYMTSDKYKILPLLLTAEVDRVQFDARERQPRCSGCRNRRGRHRWPRRGSRRRYNDSSGRQCFTLVDRTTLLDM